MHLTRCHPSRVDLPGFDAGQPSTGCGFPALPSAPQHYRRPSSWPQGHFRRQPAVDSLIPLNRPDRNGKLSDRQRANPAFLPSALVRPAVQPGQACALLMWQVRWGCHECTTRGSQCVRGNRDTGWGHRRRFAPQMRSAHAGAAAFQPDIPAGPPEPHLFKRVQEVRLPRHLPKLFEVKLGLWERPFRQQEVE